MAGGQERILRRRIKSVQSTRKITKAMELIAASQITRSQARIVANRPYREGMRRIIVEAAKADPAGAASPAAASSARLRASVIASINAAEAAIIIPRDGVATRRSARCRLPNPWTVPVMACSAKVVSSAGSFASARET